MKNSFLRERIEMFPWFKAGTNLWPTYAPSLGRVVGQLKTKAESPACQKNDNCWKWLVHGSSADYTGVSQLDRYSFLYHKLTTHHIHHIHNTHTHTDLSPQPSHYRIIPSFLPPNPPPPAYSRHHHTLHSPSAYPRSEGQAMIAQRPADGQVAAHAALGHAAALGAHALRLQWVAWAVVARQGAAAVHLRFDRGGGSWEEERLGKRSEWSNCKKRKKTLTY